MCYHAAVLIGRITGFARRSVCLLVRPSPVFPSVPLGLVTRKQNVCINLIPTMYMFSSFVNWFHLFPDAATYVLRPIRRPFFPQLHQYGRHGLHVAKPTVWSSLPVNFQNHSLTSEQFRNGLRTVLFCQALQDVAASSRQQQTNQSWS